MFMHVHIERFIHAFVFRVIVYWINTVGDLRLLSTDTVDRPHDVFYIGIRFQMLYCGQTWG